MESSIINHNFKYSKDSDEIHAMHPKSNNIEIVMGSETDDTIKELFESRLQKYQKRLEEKLRENEFSIDSIDLFHYKLHKTGLNRGGSYIDSLEWLK